MERGTCWSTLNGTPWSRSLAIAQILIPSQKGLSEMNPWRAKGPGREEATRCRLLASPPYLLRSGQGVIPLRYPFHGSGHPVEVVERRPHAAATAGTVPTAC